MADAKRRDIRGLKVVKIILEDRGVITDAAVSAGSLEPRLVVPKRLLRVLHGCQGNIVEIQDGRMTSARDRDVGSEVRSDRVAGVELALPGLDVGGVCEPAVRNLKDVVAAAGRRQELNRETPGRGRGEGLVTRDDPLLRPPQSSAHGKLVGELVIGAPKEIAGSRLGLVRIVLGVARSKGKRWRGVC